LKFDMEIKSDFVARRYKLIYKGYCARGQLEFVFPLNTILSGHRENDVAFWLKP